MISMFRRFTITFMETKQPMHSHKSWIIPLKHWCFIVYSWQWTQEHRSSLTRLLSRVSHWTLLKLTFLLHLLRSLMLLMGFVGRRRMFSELMVFWVRLWHIRLLPIWQNLSWIWALCFGIGFRWLWFWSGQTCRLTIAIEFQSSHLFKWNNSGFKHLRWDFRTEIAICYAWDYRLYSIYLLINGFILLQSE